MVEKKIFGICLGSQPINQKSLHLIWFVGETQFFQPLSSPYFPTFPMFKLCQKYSRAQKSKPLKLGKMPKSGQTHVQILACPDFRRSGWSKSFGFQIVRNLNILDVNVWKLLTSWEWHDFQCAEIQTVRILGLYCNWIIRHFGQKLLIN